MATLSSKELTKVTARAGILLAGTGRAAACLRANEMDSDGHYLWARSSDSVDSNDTWTEVDR